MNRMQKNIWLLASIGAILLLFLTLHVYMGAFLRPLPGPWPLILISGAVIVTLGTALAFSAINLWKYKFHWQGFVTILINAITIIPISYAFLVWLIVTVA